MMSATQMDINMANPAMSTADIGKNYVESEWIVSNRRRPVLHQSRASAKGGDPEGLSAPEEVSQGDSSTLNQFQSQSRRQMEAGLAELKNVRALHRATQLRKKRAEYVRSLALSCQPDWLPKSLKPAARDRRSRVNPPKGMTTPKTHGATRASTRTATSRNSVKNDEWHVGHHKTADTLFLTELDLAETTAPEDSAEEYSCDSASATPAVTFKEPSSSLLENLCSDTLDLSEQPQEVVSQVPADVTVPDFGVAPIAISQLKESKEQDATLPGSADNLKKRRRENGLKSLELLKAKKKKEEDVRNKARNSFEGGVKTGQLEAQMAKDEAARAEAKKKKEEYVRNKARNSFEGGIKTGQLEAQMAAAAQLAQEQTRALKAQAEAEMKERIRAEVEAARVKAEKEAQALKDKAFREVMALKERVQNQLKVQETKAKEEAASEAERQAQKAAAEAERKAQKEAAIAIKQGKAIEQHRAKELKKKAQQERDLQQQRAKLEEDKAKMQAESERMWAEAEVIARKFEDARLQAEQEAFARKAEVEAEAKRIRAKAEEDAKALKIKIESARKDLEVTLRSEIATEAANATIAALDAEWTLVGKTEEEEKDLDFHII